MPGGDGTPSQAPDEGVLIRAENGDVVTFDATGLTLRLSDTVLADLRRRLPLAPAAPVAAPDPAPDAADVLGDIDAWGLAQAGGWHHFTARLEPGRGARGYRRPVAGGDIIADAPGPLCALLALGGARRAGFTPGPPRWRFNVLAPGDHIGAVGLEGTAEAVRTPGLQHIPHATRESMTADRLLDWRADRGMGLPLILTRAETDNVASIAALAEGRGYANFLTAVDSLIAAAATLGRRPRVLAVGLDHTLEDPGTDPDAFVTGLRALMARVEADFNARGLARPLFLMTFEAGTRARGDQPQILAHERLARAHWPHEVLFSAPGYMFAQDRFGRPLDAARLRMAEMDAHAIAGHGAGGWRCPLPLLAETEGDGRVIRVTCDALAPLVIDAGDPLRAGPACGFGLAGTDARVKGAAVAPDDDRAVLVTLDRPVDGPARLRYAFGAADSPDEYPANRGALRDTWAAPALDGQGLLHRWALPAELPVHPGAGR
ncbi:hypothetical protein [Ruixingdingia sedimenti]|uniref:Sialate O-acetylesterase domain-containing protein n=1 Tax=Ruixingdingia sedimenti TaxID=3073604 RepID=A0ABU1F7M6_9RHOB|nr:hypothetical protein [Xinfangfangia sp. LG-4]MDR5652863.1 hypothetical protein [Xinfangfangia sp. LG-4]